MAETHVISALVAKRSELAGLVAHHRKEITRLSEEVKTLDATINCMVVEDADCGDVAYSELASMGKWLPEQVVHIRSFSKSHGPDLRLAGVGGSPEVIESVCAHRLIGPGWSSRILQSMLAALLSSPSSIKQITKARHTYEYRRSSFSSSLREQGVIVDGGDVINT